MLRKFNRRDIPDFLKRRRLPYNFKPCRGSLLAAPKGQQHLASSHEIGAMVAYLGTFDTLEEAQDAAVALVKLLFSEEHWDIRDEDDNAGNRVGTPRTRLDEHAPHVGRGPAAPQPRGGATRTCRSSSRLTAPTGR